LKAELGYLERCAVPSALANQRQKYSAYFQSISDDNVFPSYRLYGTQHCRAGECALVHAATPLSDQKTAATSSRVRLLPSRPD